jgi:hypothetical protein
MEDALAAVIRRMDERLRRETSPPESALLLSAAFALTGLRVPRSVLEQVFQGVRAMRESSAYQVILEEGAVGEAQRVILRFGQRQFGSASDAITATLKSITDLERLHRMEDQLPIVSNWDELLATP